MRLCTKYMHDIKLEGTPEEAEAWLAAAVADGWSVTDDKSSTDTYSKPIPRVARTVTIVRSLPKLPEGATGLAGSLYPAEKLAQHYPQYPAGPALVLRVQTHRAGSDTMALTWGHISGWVGVSGRFGDLCCHPVRLPESYSWDAIWALFSDLDAWEAAKEAEDLRRHKESQEAAESAREVAYAAKAKADPRQAPERFLPYVTACCRYWDNANGLEAINQKAYYRQSFKTLTGRDFDPASDTITLDEVEKLPDPTPLTEAELAAVNRPPVYSCLECGFETENPNLIDAGGMGCVRCNR